MSDLVRVVVDADECVGIGQCEDLEPEVFVFDDQTGFTSVVEGAMLPADRARYIARSCPNAAISIVEEG